MKLKDIFKNKFVNWKCLYFFYFVNMQTNKQKKKTTSVAFPHDITPNLFLGDIIVSAGCVAHS